jgi:hypothetical protein
VALRLVTPYWLLQQVGMLLVPPLLWVLLLLGQLQQQLLLAQVACWERSLLLMVAWTHQLQLLAVCWLGHHHSWWHQPPLASCYCCHWRCYCCYQPCLGLLLPAARLTIQLCLTAGLQSLHQCDWTLPEQLLLLLVVVMVVVVASLQGVPLMPSVGPVYCHCGT